MQVNELPGLSANVLKKIYQKLQKLLPKGTEFELQNLLDYINIHTNYHPETLHTLDEKHQNFVIELVKNYLGIVDEASKLEKPGYAKTYQTRRHSRQKNF